MADAVTTITTTMQFLDSDGGDYKISLSRQKELTNSEGSTIVTNLMDALMLQQITTKQLVAKHSAMQTKTIKTPIEFI